MNRSVQQLLGVTFLIFVVLLMILFVVASFFVSKVQKKTSRVELDELNEILVHNTLKPPK